MSGKGIATVVALWAMIVLAVWCGIGWAIYELVTWVTSK